MASLGDAFRSFWHTMTSYDRHSDFNAPQRTGRHIHLDGRDGLTSIATASDSRSDIRSPYRDESARPSANFESSFNGALSPGVPMSPGSGMPYSPGLRSMSARSNAGDAFETQSPTGEIPMQSFQDGMPPAPSVASSWARIDRWAEEHYPELFDQLCEGSTINDLNDLEHQLDCSLPQDVRESLAIHDGQERGGMPTGIIFGSMLLDCEEIVQEWDNWRKVNQEFLLEASYPRPAMPSKTLGGSSHASSSSAATSSAPVSPQNPNWRQDLLARQDSVPPNCIQTVYSHPAWIPLVRDWGGNNLAVDLAPGPKGTWGQVIIFGRDYDTKYVVARSWAALLATVADDLGSGRWFIDEDSGELKLREFKSARVEPGYLDILRWRADQRHGRTAQKRRSMAPRPTSTSAPTSPYANPADQNAEPRGRSMQRLSTASPMASPNRPGYGKASPLARVQEELPLSASGSNAVTAGENLMELVTPRHSGEESKENAPRLAALAANGEAGSPEAANKEVKKDSQTNGSTTAASPATSKQTAVEDETAMKTIEI
ncbi:hypothetical protein QBC42DRAFT_271468 [Cladorrhinum samala]|uniref:Knr4/Smi1-like domain-containing protein n=1 Tax=Cladorrhinum samala TaxID=585594 RepID=A0AAV9HJH6_9PEZI|nr:hypothetical protein QBC42DRAFT_271468 [Cladorrhinum samala]